MILKDKISKMLNNITLSFQFVKREIKERYTGTSLGNFWLFIHPIVMLLIYTVIFSDFMKMKIQLIDNKYAYSIYLIPGLFSWTFFSIVVDRLSNSFFEKANFIKKVNIPPYVYQISTLLTESILYLIGIILGVVFLFLISCKITFIATITLFLFMFFLSIFAFSLGVILSLFVPFFRDFRQIVPIVLQLWFWMTPIVYPKSLIFNKYPFLVEINPVYYFIEPMQNLFLYSKLPSSHHFLMAASVSFITLFLVIYLYKKMVSEIKDIL